MGILPSRMSTEATPSAPFARRGPRRTLIAPSRGWASLRLGELWHYRDLIGFLIWRDLKVRYRQTAFGVAWVLLQPLALMVVFSLFLGEFLKVNTGSTPYPVFVFSALVPWTLFSQSLTSSSSSLVANAGLLGKIYFPRLLLPISAVGSYLLDFLISSTLLIGLILVYGLTPSPAFLIVPILALLVVLAALGVGILLSAVNVRYRDVQSGVPLLVQLWLFASPIAYPLSLVPSQYRDIYALNPMVSLLQAFRWATIGDTPPTVAMVAVSLGASVAVL
ncbi:MAG: lipopolysaccharide transport system permease protein, partial [Thermoleophilaceae bacterium]|nr:lipopolysaccharide transport system permease protein [Thermoleophilaceae bacterium]